MQIVDYETFNRMPAGTVFAPYIPCDLHTVFGIKTDTGKPTGYGFVGRDWYFNGVMPLRPCFIDDDHFAFAPGAFLTEMSSYDSDSNDYADCKLFAVLDKIEIQRMIDSLYWAMDGCPVDFDEYKNRHTIRYR